MSSKCIYSLAQTEFWSVITLIMLSAPITYWWSFQIMNTVLGLPRERYDATLHKFFLMGALVLTLFLSAAVGCTVWAPANVPPGEILFCAFLTVTSILVFASSVARRNDPTNLYRMSGLRVTHEMLTFKKCEIQTKAIDVETGAGYIKGETTSARDLFEKWIVDEDPRTLYHAVARETVSQRPSAINDSAAAIMPAEPLPKKPPSNPLKKTRSGLRSGVGTRTSMRKSVMALGGEARQIKLTMLRAQQKERLYKYTQKPSMYSFFFGFACAVAGPAIHGYLSHRESIAYTTGDVFLICMQTLIVFLLGFGISFVAFEWVSPIRCAHVRAKKLVNLALRREFRDHKMAQLPFLPLVTYENINMCRFKQGV